MVLEAQSTLIVMVTTIMERGRSKCTKYWPPVSETIEVGPSLRLKTTKEESDSTSSFVYREFVLWDLTVKFRFNFPILSFFLNKYFSLLCIFNL